MLGLRCGVEVKFGFHRLSCLAVAMAFGASPVAYFDWAWCRLSGLIAGESNKILGANQMGNQCFVLLS